MAAAAQEMEIWKNLSLVDMPGEVWKPLVYNGVSYEGLYDASSMGRIKSLSKYINRSIKAGGGYTTKEIILRQSFRNGYLGFALYSKSGVKTSVRTHRAIGCTFIPNPDNKPEVNHKWGVKTDNRVEMLEWFTGKEQGEHAKRIGLTGVTKPAKPSKKQERVILPPIEFTEEELANEEWKDICGYEGLYKISNLGNVWSLGRVILIPHSSGNGSIVNSTYHAKMLKLCSTRKGYLRIDLSKNGICAQYSVHRLVAAAFNPNENNLPEVHHIDHIRNNNRATNLKWIDYPEHSKEKYEFGYVHICSRGEKQAFSKLTEVTATEIREKWASEKYKIRDLAAEYGVSDGAITKVIKRETWKHVPETEKSLHGKRGYNNIKATRQN